MWKLESSVTENMVVLELAIRQVAHWVEINQRAQFDGEAPDEPVPHVPPLLAMFMTNVDPVILVTVPIMKFWRLPVSERIRVCPGLGPRGNVPSVLRLPIVSVFDPEPRVNVLEL